MPLLVLLGGLVVCATAAWLVLASRDAEITETLVGRGELVAPLPRVFSVPCSEDYDNHQRYPGGGGGVTHSLTHSYAHSFTHAFSHPLTNCHKRLYSLTHSLACSLLHSLTP